ncbi:MAG: transcription termination/antitermination protein NusA [Bdellovibrionales bacterium CG10_big_fil_rev_8_21_14_0_10_45_34]|nr:MAG: transcription termination/antitermination protein NusA [Bdellovibrionales bacterium CG10_big_fil_rev_8_21_14_0_10_45_34]
MAADNVFSDLSRMIEQIGKDKGIDKQVIIDSIVQGMLLAARKKYGTYREITAEYNEESGEVELFEFKEVVKPEDFIDEEVEIKTNEAKLLDPDSQVGDHIGIKMDATDLGRIAVQTARQIITQKIRDAEREIIFEEFEARKGEIASGIARRVERGSIVVDLGRTEAYLPLREQIPGEVFKPGDRIQGYIADVRQSTRGPQIIMSRADERYLMKLFEIEVPEIHEGAIEIVSAAREPGSRAKIAVYSKDAAIDPVGACVGMKGSRVQNIVQELRGEKIDIVPWDEDVTRFACNALAPAEVSKVFIDDQTKEMEVVVPDTQLSLAIGRKGQNVRLAAKLTGWRIDILSESNLAQKTSEAIFNLMLIPGMSETLAQSIYQSGYGSFQSIAAARAEDIMLVPGFDDPERAGKLIKDCADLLAKYEAEGKEIPSAPIAQPSSAASEGRNSHDAKSLADQRLKEGLAELAKKSSGNGAAEEESDSSEPEAAGPGEGNDVALGGPEKAE